MTDESSPTAIRSLEAALSEAEGAATAAEAVTKQLQRTLRAMHKAACDGEVARLQRACERIAADASAVAAAAARAAAAWPYTDEQVSAYLADGFSAELIETARTAGVQLDELDDRLTAFPVLVQILDRQRALRVGARRITALRPSRVVERIRAEQRKTAVKPEQFLEVLYRAYRTVVGDTLGRGCSLAEIYDTLTLLPDARRAYSRSDFARDVFLVDSSGTRTTRSGATVSFPSATGTKGSSKAFVVVPPAGVPKYYYGIRFEEAAR